MPSGKNGISRMVTPISGGMVHTMCRHYVMFASTPEPGKSLQIMYGLVVAAYFVITEKYMLPGLTRKVLAGFV